MSESSLELIAITGRTDQSDNADLNIICNALSLFAVAVHIKR